MGKSKSGRSTLVIGSDGTITRISGRSDREVAVNMVRKGLIEATPPTTSAPQPKSQ